ncbi:HD domain-containing phosphohydrolase [Mesobacillus subterraneus]|uniref:HD-GYP domain-containing protein n=1 Tax=Mesobacillus subterraneus TaxID=285983 RepID=UPI001CFF2E0A|nr:HD domain-containing phosphohydrolase [Mesobacillus subterraneus]WLR55485.1 HD domain-containing phosphohydrolase [Mesobacillus subterraneus]
MQRSSAIQYNNFIGERILFWGAVFMSGGSILGAIGWLVYKTEKYQDILAAFLVCSFFQWGFYFLNRKALFHQNYSPHFNACFTFLMFGFTALYNPLRYSEIWVLLLFYPILLGLSSTRRVFFIWSSSYFILFNLHMFITAPITEANLFIFVMRSMFSLAAIGIGWLIHASLLHMNQKSKDDQIRHKKDHILKVLNALIPIAERKSQIDKNEIFSMSNLMKKIVTHLPEEKIEEWEMELLSVLHYVSRVNWPDYMFEKQDKLSSFEFEVIKAHCVFGHELIGEDEDFNRISVAILHHHERLNGTGYPNQLREAQIPVAAQILGITESFLAMTEPRSYRDAKTSLEAFEEILEGKGILYREDLVGALGEALGINDYYIGNVERAV